MRTTREPETRQPPPRVVIDAVRPEIDAGRYRAKCTAGERFDVVAHAFADGHDRLSVRLRYRGPGESDWREVPMAEQPDDEWSASFTPQHLGQHEYTVEGGIDRFGSWLADLQKRIAAGWDVNAELLEGAELVEQTAALTRGDARLSLRTAATWLRDQSLPQARRIDVALDAALAETMAAHRDRSEDACYPRTLRLWVDRERARFGAWYEMFPRSVTPDPERSATFREAASRLPEIAKMGFDVLYLPPVHPIGQTERKGPNNTLHAKPGDPGSPWAIGAREGGHTAVHPDLGTLADFEWFVAESAHHGLDIALDIAFQCSPDHPWVTEHPQWFRHRPDGSIRYAENPPKQYQDIYPIDFDTDDWRALWAELLDVVLFWVERGVRIFRVDNPHTKPFPFWEWLIEQVHAEHPDVIFLAEAFTRRKRLYGLAKLGFTQSYHYFTWRNTKPEIVEYGEELTAYPARHFLRANLFANTPDILHEYLQHGGTPAFRVRLALAATLGPSYGIYSGFELSENVARERGSEEYRDSEKFQLRPRDYDAPGNLKAEIARWNTIRREHPALQHNHRLWFLPIENPQVVACLKADPEGRDHVLTVVNLDSHGTQSGWVGLPLAELGLRPGTPFVAHELLSGRRATWAGEWNHVALDPTEQPAQIFAFEASEDSAGVRP